MHPRNPAVSMDGEQPRTNPHMDLKSTYQKTGRGGAGLYYYSFFLFCRAADVSALSSRQMRLMEPCVMVTELQCSCSQSPPSWHLEPREDGARNSSSWRCEDQDGKTTDSWVRLGKRPISLPPMLRVPTKWNVPVVRHKLTVVS